MTALRFYFLNKQSGDPFKRWSSLISKRVRDAMKTAAAWAAMEIQSKGRDDIARAGRFGDRWINGLRVSVTSGGGHIKISVTHDVPYFAVFQDGAVIKGRPLLWLPAPWRDDVRKIESYKSPREYPGKLFKVQPKGRAFPILMRCDTKEVIYIAVDQVKIPKKFHLREIVQRASEGVQKAYERRLRQTRGEF